MRTAKEPPPETGSEALNRPYDPVAVERRWYEVWEKKGYFTPKGENGREPFVISMPPPNLTGVLHYGHVVIVTFEDLMIRWRRMQGYATLWLPGTDHAAIATNAVILDNIAKEGRTRDEIGREGFEDLFWDWLDKSGSAIRSQLRRAGASCDWSRERFTMDEGLTRAVNEAFIRLYEKGLIYKDRIWSTGTLRTARRSRISKSYTNPLWASCGTSGIPSRMAGTSWSRPQGPRRFWETRP